MPDVEELGWNIFFLFCVILFFGSIIEIGIFMYAYYNADTVRCSWYGCEFTTQRRTITEDCFMNGIKVNCSEIRQFDAWQ